MFRCDNILYFDYNASAPMLPEVKDVFISALDWLGNPSSVHQLGRRCRFAVNQARNQLGHALNAHPKGITFTSGGTEANHLALTGLGLPKQNIYATEIEHASIHKNILRSNLIPVDHKGQVKIGVLAEAFRRPHPPKLLSIGLANSETGILQDLYPVIDLCHQHGCLVHTDAVQAVGKVPVSFQKLRVDLLSVAAHKIGGPKGIGALISKPDLILKAPLLGGAQEKGLRSGTENIPAIVGFGVAAQCIAQRDWTVAAQLIKDMMAELALFNPSVRFNSLPRGLPNTLNFSTPGYHKDTQVIHFDLHKIAISAGSACSSGKVERSHVLHAMGLTPTYSNSAIRLSLGPTTPRDAINHFVDVWKMMQHTQKLKDNVHGTYSA